MTSRLKGGLQTVLGQRSYEISTRQVHAYITERGAMLGPAYFFAQRSDSVQPFSIPPWANEPEAPSLLPFLRALRGDFVCSAFGDNAEPINGRRVPVHGDTAHATWRLVERRRTPLAACLRIGADLTTQGGSAEATTVLREDQPVIYQRHDFIGIEGPITPGHHAMLRCEPPPAPAAQLSFSPHVFAQTSPLTAEGRAGHARYSLAPATIIDDLRVAPCLDGAVADLTSFPARNGCDDVAILCSDPNRRLAWSAVTHPSQKYVWFAIRSAALLPITLLWFSNGGKLAPPWSARHLNVIGIEDMIGFFNEGVAASARDNPLCARGIPTCHLAKSHCPLRIPYVQGVARIPPEFDRVVDLEHVDEGHVLLKAARSEVLVECYADFAMDGNIERLLSDSR